MTQYLKEDGSKSVVSSHLEKVLFEKVAPILLNSKVKAVILLLFSILTGICLYGCLQMKIYYNVDLNVDEGFISYDYM